jgi:hypothetical protein
MICEFIEKIVVHAKDERYVKTASQRVEIHLNFIDEFEALHAEREPTPKEPAEQERIEKERERNRLRCLKRKADGYCNKPKTALPMAASL